MKWYSPGHSLSVTSPERSAARRCRTLGQRNDVVLAVHHEQGDLDLAGTHQRLCSGFADDGRQADGDPLVHQRVGVIGVQHADVMADLVSIRAHAVADRHGGHKVSQRSDLAHGSR